MRKTLYVSLFIGIVVSLSACAPKRQVQRISTDEQIDLSGRWNDSDSRLVAEDLVLQLLHDPWLNSYKSATNGKRPIIIVGLVRNKSHEHIDSETFIKDIERAIVKDGNARLVQAGSKRNELRDERVDQQNYASAETAKDWGLELGADFMLQGTINSIVDVYKREKIVFYQINLELSNLETNEVVWIGEKEIKKYINN